MVRLATNSPAQSIPSSGSSRNDRKPTRMAKHMSLPTTNGEDGLTKGIATHVEVTDTTIGAEGGRSTTLGQRTTPASTTTRTCQTRDRRSMSTPIQHFRNRYLMRLQTTKVLRTGRGSMVNLFMSIPTLNLVLRANWNA